MRLSGKVAIVTGGGVGIGKGISDCLAARGARVVIAQRRADKAEAAAADIVAAGGQAIGVQSDVTDRNQVRSLIRTATEWGGGLDVLVNNAAISGLAKFSAFMDMSEELWDQVMSANLKGPLLCSQEAARVMIEQRSGKIINISSIMGLTGEEYSANYCTSKAGLIALTKVMALELSPHRINVNCIAPGFIQTETVQPILDLVNSDDSPYRFARQTPFGPGQPRDIGDAVVFLASDESAFCTGSTFVVDGGFLAY